MMEGKIPPSNESNPLHELSGALRPAVEQVRSSMPPGEAIERAVERAQRLGPPLWRPSRRRLAWVAAAAGIAAVILVGFGLWPKIAPPAFEQVAWHREAAKESAPASPPADAKPAEPEGLLMLEARSDYQNPIKKPGGDFKNPDQAEKEGIRKAELIRQNSEKETPRARNPMMMGGHGTGSTTGLDPELTSGQFSSMFRATADGKPPARPVPAQTPSFDRSGGGEDKGKNSYEFMHEREGEEKKGKEVTGEGRYLPAKDRAKAVEELKRVQADLESRKQEVTRLRELSANSPARFSKRDFEQAIEKLRDAEKRVQTYQMRMGEGAPTTRQNAVKTAEAYRDFHKKQLKRYQDLFAERSIDGKVVDELESRLQKTDKLAKALEADAKDSPASPAELLDQVKQEIRTQELVLNRTILGRTKNADLARKAVRETREDLAALETRISELNLQARSQPDKKQPQVWHRDRGRPTFARVYVGDGNSLELVSLRVSVTVEGPRARTVVDHVFRNPHNRQLEGTFEYPLPSGASPSYFAMFLGQTRDTAPALFNRRGGEAPLPAEALARLTPAELVKHVDTADWGRLQEARIVGKQKALETYEEIVRGRIDPALLEYSGGNTFSGRVFPIPAKGYNRVLLAYEELLPIAQERMMYRFPLPGRPLNELQFSLQARSGECLKPSFLPKDASKEESGDRITFSRTWKDAKPEGEMLFACTPANAEVQAISGRQGDNGPRYLYARLRPQLKTIANARPSAEHAVFLLDTSLSEHPERFDVSMKLLRKILETDAGIKQFNILTFNVGAAWLDAKGFLDNTAEGRAKALKKLDGLVLEGATDISCALDKLAQPGFDIPAGTNLNVFLLSDGHITWGEPDVAALVARFEQRCPYPTRFHCYRTGLGEENSELFEALTRQGGGIFQCYGEADVEPAARAHQSECLKVSRVRFVGGPDANDVLIAGRRAAVYPGGELVVAARFPGTGRTTVLVEGEFAGKKVAQEFPLEVGSVGELAPRAWAEIAVSSLLALHDSNLDTLVTAYCQQFGIVSRVASFLVLENEADYKRLNLEEERGKTLAGDLGVFLADMWTRLGKGAPAGEAFQRFLSQIDRRVRLLNGPNGAHVRQMLNVLKEADFELPTEFVRGGLLYQKDVATYLGERAGERGRRDVGIYLKEARRRADAGDVDGAVRVLSSIVEEHPARGDALRLVGYRLLDFQQPGQAARLFNRVQRERPFEPHSYRDLAHALEESGRFGLAAVNYEIVLAGNWHNRFRQELKTVAQEEYAHMMQEAIRQKRVKGSLANLFGERLEQMVRPQPQSDLRVTISWNTDATDIDLWVIEPDGTKCFYSHNRTKSGGELSQDQTQGYGPERYQIAKAQPGVYTIIVHYFRPNPNLLGGETHVNARVSRFAGTPQEKVERHTIILKKHDEQVEVGKVKF